MSKATACDGKQAYDTKRAAEAERMAMRRRIRIPVRLGVYRCPHCRKFHIGNRNVLGHRPTMRA